MSDRLRVVLATALLTLSTHQALYAQDMRTISQSRQVAGERALQVDVEYAAGTLKLGPAADGGLYRMTMRYDADVITPRVAYRSSRLRVGMEDAQIRGGRNMKGGLLDLRLGTTVPVELEVQFGAAEAEIELGGLLLRKAEIATGASTTKLSVSTPNGESCELIAFEMGAAQFEARQLGNLNARRLTLQGGVGEVTLDFTGRWQQDMSGSIEMGLGTLNLRVPRGLGVRIRKGGLLSSFDSQGLVKRGDYHQSENWDSATHKLSLDIDSALGSINVVWVDS